MIQIHAIRNAEGDITHINCPLNGYALLNNPKLNKGGAFTAEERAIFGLLGTLPEHIETLDEQCERTYQQYQ